MNQFNTRFLLVMSNTSDSESTGTEGLDLFQEPEGYYPPAPKDKTEVFERNPDNIIDRDQPRQLKVRLVGTHPLWGHYLWNAAKVFANYLDADKDLVRKKTVVELGAAGALPSLVSICNGAKRVVITDYPDPDLVDNIRKNVELNYPQNSYEHTAVARVEGFKWGYEIDRILELNEPSNARFDVLILSDLVFNHSEHSSLLKSVDRLMAKPDPNGTKEGGKAFVFFTHHRPWLADKDMGFLDRAQKELGLVVTRVVEEYTGAMFDDDPGDAKVRGTVHGFRMEYPQ